MSASAELLVSLARSIQCTDGIAEYRAVIVIAFCLNCTLTGSNRPTGDDDVDDEEDDGAPPEKVNVQLTIQKFYLQHCHEVFISYYFILLCSRPKSISIKIMCDIFIWFYLGKPYFDHGCRSPVILIPGDNDENLGILGLTGLF